MEYELIEKVSQHPFLIDKSLKEYRNVELKEQTWMKIASELNKPTDKVKRRWKTLRDRYLRELKCSSSKRQWKYFDFLEFLSDIHKIQPPNEQNERKIVQNSPNVKKEFLTTRTYKSARLLAPKISIKDIAELQATPIPPQIILGNEDKNETNFIMEQQLTEPREITETSLFMDSMVAKIRTANLSCDELEDIQESILSLINKKLRQYRRNKLKNKV